MLAAVGLVALATVGAYRFWDHATQTRDDNGGVLAAGPSTTTSSSTGDLPAGTVIVSGTVTSVHMENATVPTLAMPITVTPDERGRGGATITPVQVDGKTTSIDWQAGQPLPMKGDGGALKLDPITIDATTDGITMLLDGVHAVVPGTYTLSTSVAVGSTPRDSVTFTATDKTTIQFRDGQRTPLPTPDLSLSGTGKVTLEGTLTVEHADHTKTPMTNLTLDNGAYRIVLTPVDGGFRLQALLPDSIHP